MISKDNAIKKLDRRAITRWYLMENSGRLNNKWNITYKIKLENKVTWDWFFCISSENFFDNIKHAMNYLKDKPFTEDWIELWE